MNEIKRPRIDYTDKDYASLREAMLALAREKLPEWTDHSPNDLGVVLIELLATMGDMLAYYQDRIANESYLETAVERRSVMNLLRLIGCELRPVQSATADLMLILEDDKEITIITVPAQAEFKTKASPTSPEVTFRYATDDDLQITLLQLPQLPDALQKFNIDAKRMPFKPEEGKNYRCVSLPVIQVDAAVSEETVGSSDGRSGQRFPLRQQPLIDKYLQVTVQEGGSRKRWRQVQRLLHSLSDDEHFVARYDADGFAWIEFGDGDFGRIPPKGQNNILASYLVGGGSKGNAPAYSIVQGPSDIPQLKAVFNPNPASNGREAESEREAAQRAPYLFRSQGRAVTTADYEVHARQFGIGKVRAVASPGSPTGLSSVDLVVAPAGGGYPSDTLKEDLNSYFADKRVVTTALTIKDPVYVKVFVEGTLEVDPYYFADRVRQQAEQAVSRLLAFDAVSFGKTLYLSKFYAEIEAIEGVASVEITGFCKNETSGVSPKLDFAVMELPIAHYPTGINFTKVRGGQHGH